MRIKTIFLSLLLLITSIAYSQTPIQVTRSEKVLGKNLLDNSVINGKEYVFPDRIHRTFLDTTTGIFTIQLRGLNKNEKYLNNSGKIIQYDIAKHTILWSKKIAYQSGSLLQFNKTIIQSFGAKSYCIDIRTGTQLWEVKNNIYFVEPISNIGIGYKFKSLGFNYNDLEGLNLKNGELIWTRKLNREFGWNNVFYMNDTTILVVSSGLHAINIKTGKGWDYDAATGKRNNLGIQPDFASSTRDLVSNIIMDTSYIYIATKDQLAKIEKQTGKIVWKFSLPDYVVSKSSIFIKDSILFMVNSGKAFMGYRELDFGEPFFASFNINSGKYLFLSYIKNDRGSVLNFKVLKNELFLLFKNKIVKYSMETGKELLSKSYPKDSIGEFKYFVGEQVFITSQTGDLINLIESDSTKVFIYTNKDKTLSFDEQLNITKTIDFEDLSIYYKQKKDFKFIAKDKETQIVNTQGKSIAEIQATSKAFIIDNNLYDMQENKLITIDLSNILTIK